MIKQILKFLFTLVLISLLAIHLAIGQELSSFPSLTRVEGNGKLKANYPKLTTLFGSVNSEAKVRYVYVWIPVPTSDLGMRVISPVGNLIPSSGDMVENISQAQKVVYFDPGTALELPEKPVTKPSDIESLGNQTKWNTSFFNDDNAFLLAQPNGKNTNSQTHAVFTAPLLHGLYRVKLSAEKETVLKGSFCLQLGAINNPNGVIIAPDLKALSKLVNNP